MTKLNLISVSKPPNGSAFKQQFNFDAVINRENGLEIKYFDNTINSDTHIKLNKKTGFIKNKNLTINLLKSGSLSKIKTEHGEMELNFVYKTHKVFKKTAIIAYAIYDNKTNTKLSDNLIKYKWS